MHLTKVNHLRRYKRTIDRFGGLNLLSEIGENEFTAMKNMSLDEYPVISSRIFNRDIKINLSDTSGTSMTISPGTIFFYNDGWGFVDGTTGNLYYSGDLIAPGFGIAIDTTLNIGSKVLFFPDKTYFDTQTGEYGNLYGNFTCIAGDLATVGLVFDGGANAAESVSFLLSPPENPQTRAVYFYSDADGCHCYRYNEYGDGEWYPLTTTEYKITCSSLTGGFKEGDTVTVENSPSGRFDGQYTVSGVGSGYILLRETPVHKRLLALAAAGSTTGYKSGFFGSIKRNVPDLAYACVCNNRVWGCSEDGHEIYASKLGDPFNWYSFEGLVSDSYAATVGSDGPFTGAIEYLGHPCFFKEDELIKVYGTKPANFQFSKSSINGVKTGAARTLAVVKDALYYYSRNGIYRYAGGTPQFISYNLPKIEFSSAGVYRDKYYVNSSDTIYVFDPDTHSFCTQKFGENLTVRYFITFFGGLGLVHSTGLVQVGDSPITWTGEHNQTQRTAYETKIEWSLTTKELSAGLNYRKNSGWDDPYNNRVCGVQIEASGSGYMKVEAQYDCQGEWHPLGTYNQLQRDIKLFKLLPCRCRFIKLRISGEGSVKIYSISYGIER